MKTRLNFVSNSSSTSFVIAVPDKEERCEHCGRNNYHDIEVLKFLIAAYDIENMAGTNVKWIDAYEKRKIAIEIMDLKKDKRWAQEKIKVLDDLKGNYLINHAITKIEEVLKSFMGDDPSDQRIRWSRLDNEGGWNKVDKNAFTLELEALKTCVEECDKKIPLLINKLKSMSKYKKANSRICHIEIDNSASAVGRLIRDLLDSGRIDIIEKVST